MKGSNKMKKCRNCVALIMAMIMMLTAFSVMPMTSSAESTNVRTGYPVVTRADSLDCSHLNNSNEKTSHIWNSSNKPAYITVTLKKPDNKTVIINYVVKLWTDNGVNKWQYGRFDKDDKFVEEYINQNNVHVNTEEKINNEKFCFQYILQKNCDVLTNKAKVNPKSRRHLNIVFSAGDFNVNGFFRVYSNTVITGDGTKTKLYKANSNPVFINFDNDDLNTKGYNGSRNITVKNFTVSGGKENSKTHRPSSFLYFVHGSGLTVQNITVENALYYSHVFQLTASENIKIDNCNFKNILYTESVDTKNKRGDVIYRKATEKSLEIKDFNQKSEIIKGKNSTRKFFQFEVVQIEPDQPGSMPTIRTSWDGTPSQNVTIQNSHFDGVVRAIGSHAAGVNPCYNIKIYNNRFDNIVGNAITLPYKLQPTPIKKGSYEDIDIKTTNKNIKCKIGIKILNITRNDVYIYNNNVFRNISNKKIKGSCIYYVKGKNINFKKKNKKNNNNVFDADCIKYTPVSKY